MNEHDDINSGLFKSTHARAARNKIGEQENFDKTQRWAACKKSIKSRDEKFTRQLFSKEQGVPSIKETIAKQKHVVRESVNQNSKHISRYGTACE